MYAVFYNAEKDDIKEFGPYAKIVLNKDTTICGLDKNGNLLREFVYQTYTGWLIGGDETEDHYVVEIAVEDFQTRVANSIKE